MTKISISLASPSGPLYKEVRQQVSLHYPGVIRADYQQDNGAVSADLADLEINPLIYVFSLQICQTWRITTSLPGTTPTSSSYFATECQR